jgi:hypothetical protein
MTIDVKIMTVGKLRGGMCAVAAGIKLRWYFILKPNFPLTFFYFNAYPPNDTLFHYTDPL